VVNDKYELCNIKEILKMWKWEIGK
jgi:hypothetical protein